MSRSATYRVGVVTAAVLGACALSALTAKADDSGPLIRAPGQRQARDERVVQVLPQPTAVSSTSEDRPLFRAPGRRQRFPALPTVSASSSVSSNEAVKQRVSTGWFGGRPDQASALVERGRQALAQGQADTAIQWYLAALDQNPGSMLAHLGLGAAYRTKGDYERGAQAYEAALTLHPNSFEGWYGQGLCRQQADQPAKAITCYLRALAIQPDSFEANRDLASSYSQAGQPGSALPYAKKAAELRPQDQAAGANLATVYSLQGRFAEAAAAFNQAAQLGPVQEPIVLGLADAQLRLGRIDEAIATLETYLRDRYSAVGHERLGYCRFKKRQFDQAVYHYRAALALKSDNTAALNGLGVCLMALSMQAGPSPQAATLREEALQSWRQSLAVDRQQPQVMSLLSRYEQSAQP